MARLQTIDIDALEAVAGGYASDPMSSLDQCVWPNPGRSPKHAAKRDLLRRIQRPQGITS